MFAPAVVVHGLPHVRLALRRQRPVCLLSAPGAGRFAGVAWWRAMLDAAHDERAAPAPGTFAATICDILDCDDAPGAAMAALRHGQMRLILDPRCPAFAAVAAVAGTLGAIVLPSRPAALDLAAPNAERALAAWLDGTGLA